MHTELREALGLAVAALIGLAVGIERQWSGHATGPAARFAGTRTFLLFGLLGGIAGLLVRHGEPWIGVVLLAGAAALTVAAYLVVARRATENATDGTTEAAALVVLALSVTAALGELRLAAAAAAVVVLVLREKGAIHAFVGRIADVELRAALQFAVLALVILPILPEGPYGPLGGVRPRELWLVVLLVSGLNFLGYLAQRAVGPSRGSAVAGMLGGLVSSTAVTLAFSRQSRDTTVPARPLGLGVIGACTMLLPRLVVLTLILERALTPKLVPFLLPPFLVGVAILALGLRRDHQGDGDGAPDSGRNPLRLGEAMLLAVGFQAALMLFAFVRGQFGASGVLASAGLMGLTDMDALTFSMSRMAGDAAQVPLAATAMAVGVLSNTFLKLGVVGVVGAGAFRRMAAMGLLAMAMASGLGLWLGRALQAP